MKVSKKRLLQIIYEEVERLKEDRFSDTTKSVMDSRTRPIPKEPRDDSS